MENLKDFRYPTTAKWGKITILGKKTAIWDLNRDYGVCISRPISVYTL